VAIGTHRPHLLHLDPVDLAHLAHEQIDQRGIGQLHHQLVDGLPRTGLEDLDADDVALHRTDPAGHRTEGTGPIGQPDAQDVALHGADPRRRR
jgi:hypothetical protein